MLSPRPGGAWWPAPSTAASSRSGSRPSSTRSAESEGQVITFIDELHTVVGAGAGGDSPMDAGNMLKPMLARGELHMIGATTLDEYREYIEKDAALERRFQQVFVGEPSRRGHHRRSCAASRRSTRRTTAYGSPTPPWSPPPTLSDRYITGRQLPDKAIDLVDEAASRLRMEIDSSPGGDRPAHAARSTGCKMEELALAKESDDASQRAAGGAARATSPTRRRSSRELEARWEAREGQAWRARAQLRRQLDQLRVEADKLTARGRPRHGASEIHYGQIPAPGAADSRPPRTSRGDAEHACRERWSARRSARTQIAEVVAAWTGIPTGRLLQGETDKLLRHGAGARRAADRPARGRRARSPTRSAVPGPGIADPNRPDRLVPVPRPDRRRQDRAAPRRSRTSSSTTSGRWSAST